MTTNKIPEPFFDETVNEWRITVNRGNYIEAYWGKTPEDVIASYNFNHSN